jgi:TolA-binding protein
MKLDIKSIIILILIIFSTISAYHWFIKGDDLSKEKIKRWEDEFKKLQREKDSISINITNLKLRFNELNKKKDSLESQNKLLENKIIEVEKESQKSKTELNEMRKNQKATLKEIENLKNNPIRREGEDLLESLKNKTK